MATKFAATATSASADRAGAAITGVRISRAVMIGRAYLWGLAAAGQAGVENVLDILSSGIDSALRALGKSSIHDLTAEDVLVPDGFVRRLGVSD